MHHEPKHVVPNDATRSIASRRQLGFTLVEVMVVVLIIGILLAVGIPTFLGARNNAHDIAAQSSLDVALDTVNAAILSEPGANLTDADPTALGRAEPSLTFLPGSQPSAGPNEVSIDASSIDRWVATVQSSSGTCFGAEITPAGITTYTSGSCAAGAAVNVSTPVNVAPSSTPSMSSDWPTGSYGVENMIDGAIDTFAHSGWQSGQSAAFDLGSSVSIEEVRLWNRADCCPGRMKNMWIFVSDSPVSADLGTAQASGASSFNLPGEVGSPSSIPINVVGQHVRVFSGGPVLHLAEIEIMAVP